MEVVVRYFKAVWVLSRPLNSIHPLALLYIGGVLAKAPFAELLGALILYFIVHGAVTLQNDLDDIVVDAANGRDVSAARFVDGNGGRLLVWVLYGGSILASLLYFPVIFTVLLVAVIGGSWVYNSKPLQLSRRPLGSIMILGVCYGAVPVLAGAALGTVMNFWLILIALGFGVSRVSLSILKDYKDAKGDAQHNKKTFLLVYGRTVVRKASIVLAVIGYTVAIVALEYFLPPVPTILVGAGLTSAVALWLIFERRKLTPTKSYDELNQQFHRLLSYEVLLYGAVILWVTISLV